jgi:hypothetical protein
VKNGVFIFLVFKSQRLSAKVWAFSKFYTLKLIRYTRLSAANKVFFNSILESYLAISSFFTSTLNNQLHYKVLDSMVNIDIGCFFLPHLYSAIIGKLSFRLFFNSLIRTLFFVKIDYYCCLNMIGMHQHSYHLKVKNRFDGLFTTIRFA